MKNKSGISRRSFIKGSAFGVAALTLTPFNSIIANTLPSDWDKEAAKYTIRMIGHGHIDPVWLWRWTEGVAIVHSTFRSALDRMKEVPGMIFTASSAQFYQWIADNDSQMMQEIRQRVKEGRWNIVGGWWIEPDVNIPSGESLVRQGLYGQLTFQKLVGRRAVVGFNPDSFGHPGTLPQILKKQGLDNYVFMRPAAHEKNIPANLFWWEAPDGSKVLTYRICNSYGDGGSSVHRNIDALLKIAKDQPMKTFMSFYGVGDHGGGPTKENLKAIEEAKKEEGAPKITYGSTDRYFEEMRADKSLSIPVLKDDLQHHSVGCYTGGSVIKKGNCQSEIALVSAETICAVGSEMWSAKYPKSEFEAAWHKVLFYQFHDSMAGTSLVSHTDDVVEAHGFAQSTANHASALAIQTLEWQIAAEDPDSHYVVVFNPHAWEVKTNVHYDFGWGESDANTSMVDAEGKAVPCQRVLAESQCGNRRGFIFTATLPPMGYQQFRLVKSAPLKLDKPASADGNTLENEFYKIRFNSDGMLGIYDKENKKEVFDGQTGCRAVVIKDMSDTWSHDIKTYDDEIGNFGNANIKVLENGPLRAVVRVSSAFGDSKLVIDWSLFAGSREIGADVTLDWHEHHKILKFCFPVDIDSPVPTYEVPYGHIVRDINGDENPGQRWIDLSGSKDSLNYGLSVLNDAKYGYSVKDNDMRVSIARAAVYAHHNPAKLQDDKEYVWMDQGIQTFRMQVIPHRGDWKEAAIPAKAEVFKSRPIAIYQGIHRGHLPKSGSFMKVDGPNVCVTAVKKSESGDDMIIRCVEMFGEPATATIHFPSNNFSWTGKFVASEIKTLRYSPKKRTIKEVNLLEE